MALLLKSENMSESSCMELRSSCIKCTPTPQQPVATEVHFSSTRESDTRGLGQLAGGAAACPVSTPTTWPREPLPNRTQVSKVTLDINTRRRRRNSTKRFIGCVLWADPRIPFAHIPMVELCPRTICKFKRGWEMQWSFVPREENKQVFLNS